MSSGQGYARGSHSRSSSDQASSTFAILDPHSVEEYGRTFQTYRAGNYYLPNDSEEQDRLDLQHKIWNLLMHDQLNWAPIGQVENVLDIGTGTGIWAIRFARKNPQTKVIGVDLSLIQPNTPPPNCTFIRGDAEEQWDFGQDRFDFIHLRSMCTCFTDSRKVVQTIYDNLKPGGWVEYQDFAWELIGADAAVQALINASPVARWLELVVHGMHNARGRDITVPRRYKEWLKDTGFTNVREEQLLCPLNGWPLTPEDKLLGQFCHLDIEKFLDSSVKILVAAGMAEAEIPEFVSSVRYSMRDVKLRGYFVCYVVYGQKPLD